MFYLFVLRFGPTVGTERRVPGTLSYKVRSCLASIRFDTSVGVLTWAESPYIHSYLTGPSELAQHEGAHTVTQTIRHKDMNADHEGQGTTTSQKRQPATARNSSRATDTDRTAAIGIYTPSQHPRDGESLQTYIYNCGRRQRRCLPMRIPPSRVAVLMLQRCYNGPL